jgi:hypothetical protein
LASQNRQIHERCESCRAKIRTPDRCEESRPRGHLPVPMCMRHRSGFVPFPVSVQNQEALWLSLPAVIFSHRLAYPPLFRFAWRPSCAPDARISNVAVNAGSLLRHRTMHCVSPLRSRGRFRLLSVDDQGREGLPKISCRYGTATSGDDVRPDQSV